MMKPALIVAVLLSIHLPGPAAAQGPPPPPPPMSDDYFPARWTDYVPAEGGFAVRFPGKPTETTEEGDASGVRLVVRGSTFRGLGHYVIAWIDFPADFEAAGRAGELFDVFQNALLEAATGHAPTVVEKKELTVHGHPARYVRVDVGKSTAARARWVVVKNRLYEQKFVVGKHGAGAFKSEGAYQELATAFFESFRLLPPGVAPGPR